MKTILALSLGILGLITVSGTVVNADDTASVSALQSVKIESEMLAKLKTEAPFSDSTFRRPI